MDLERELRESMSRLCDVPESEIQLDARVDNLGFDSLASAEVLTDLEIKLGFEFPVDALRRLNSAETVGDVLAVLQHAVPASPGG